MAMQQATEKELLARQAASENVAHGRIGFQRGRIDTNRLSLQQLGRKIGTQALSPHPHRDLKP
jgi:hypothetical protein